MRVIPKKQERLFLGDQVSPDVETHNATGFQPGDDPLDERWSEQSGTILLGKQFRIDPARPVEGSKDEPRPARFHLLPEPKGRRHGSVEFTLLREGAEKLAIQGQGQVPLLVEVQDRKLWNVDRVDPSGDTWIRAMRICTFSADDCPGSDARLSSFTLCENLVPPRKPHLIKLPAHQPSMRLFSSISMGIW